MLSRSSRGRVRKAARLGVFCSFASAAWFLVPSSIVASICIVIDGIFVAEAVPQEYLLDSKNTKLDKACDYWNDLCCQL